MAHQEILKKAEEAYLLGNLSLVEELCSNVIAECDKNSVAFADATRQLGRLAIFQGDFPKALELSNSALAVSLESDNKALIARIYSTLATAYFNLSDYTPAIEYYNKAISIFESLDLVALAALNYNNIANIYTHQGLYEPALRYYTKALDMAEAVGSNHTAALALGNIGILYKDMGIYDTALTYSEKALNMAIAIGNKQVMLNGYSNVGLIRMGLKDYDSALDYFNKAISMAVELGNKTVEAVTGGNAGLVYLNMKDYKKALHCFDTALATSEEIGNRQGSAVLYQNLGLLYTIPDFKDANAEKAEAYLKKSVSLNRELGTKNSLIEAYETLAQLYKQQQRWKECSEHMEMFFNIHSEVKNEETQKKVTGFIFERDMAIKEAEHKATEKILHNILPKSIADKIKDGEEKIIQKFSCASVLFADMVGFTVWSKMRDVNEVAETLNHIFNLFDELANEFGVEKIKTIGDAYMCVSGLPEPVADHAERMAKMALAMNKKIDEAYPNGEIKLRIGIHSGEVIAGVLGKNKYAYDLWGDTVNTASRMESHGVANKIQVSDDFRNLLADKFCFTERGVIEVKGKGEMKTWFLGNH